MDMLRFGYSWFLWGLLLVPVFVVAFVLVNTWRQRAIQRLGDSHLVNRLMPDRSVGKPVVKLVLFCTAFTALIIGLANPQIGSRLEEVKREGVDLMILLDVSESMNAEDLTPNRLQKAKRAISKLVDRVVNDRIGIIVFAGEAYVQLPITTDYSAAKLFLGTISTGSVGQQGTDIGNAIDLALESFDYENGSGKSIIIITDGENHEPHAVSSAKDAAEKGVAVHTIGMGSENGVPIPMFSGRNRIGHRKDAQGNTVITKLNKKMLEDIASEGNGIFVRATNAETGLDYIFGEIEKMETAEFGSMVYADYEDQFQYFIGLALLLFFFEFLISEKRTRWISAIFDPAQKTQGR